MFTGKLKILIITALLSASACFSSYAAVKSSIPFDVEFDYDDGLERLCYAGHSGNTVKYKDGVAVLPDASFTIVPRSTGSEADIKALSAEISVIYENDDNTGSYRETIRTFEKGSLEAGESYQLLSENAIASLEERELLYSGSLQGLTMTVSYELRDKKKDTLYIYICDDDDYCMYLENAQE